MDYLETKPSPRLAGFIKCFWALEYPGSGEPEPVLPDGCPELVFNLSEPFMRVYSGHEERQPTALLAGQMSRSILIRPSGKVKLFGVRFQPAGAAPLLGFPLHELNDEIVEFRRVGVRQAYDVEHRMTEALSFAERRSIFEEFLIQRLAECKQNDPVSCIAAVMIDNRCGRVPVSEVSRQLGISERQLERRFKRTVGISPKMLSRIARFQSVVRACRDGEFPNLLDAALSSGYYDQSHLIRDFREFSGLTPLAYFERTHRIADVFTGAV
ncbi:MAG TPA: DUF6597 domain-containing transcriptional factor [Pyrinomonadaceae bacterium]